MGDHGNTAVIIAQDQAKRICLEDFRECQHHYKDLATRTLDLVKQLFA